MSEHRNRWLGLATKAIHAGFRPDPGTGAVNAPIYASSTFAQDGVGGLRGGFEYARTGNPTRSALEASLAAVEEAEYGRAFSSGMAASDCVLRPCCNPATTSSRVSVVSAERAAIACRDVRTCATRSG